MIGRTETERWKQGEVEVDGIMKRSMQVAKWAQIKRPARFRERHGDADGVAGCF